MANPANFPNRPFRLEAYTWLINQNVAANTSTVGYSLWIKKNSYSPSRSSGPSSWNFWINGVQVNSNTFTYDFTSSDELLLVSGSYTLTHLPDGSAPFAFAGNCTADILGSATADSVGGALPTIPRASVTAISAPYTRDIGVPVTLFTNRASASFTHTITYTFGAASGTVGTGVGDSVAWTPPLSLLNQIPDRTSALVTITTTTYNGGSWVGVTSGQFTLAAGPGVVPTISSVAASDSNPDVVSIVGKFVQGLSVLKGTVNAAGVAGSTITERAFKMGDTVVPSGGEIPVVQSGVVPVTASARDSRGRVAAWSGTVDVIPYASPLLSLVLVRRCTPSGTVADNGTSLRVDLKAAVQSLMNTTQRNALTIRVFTRPYGGASWTPRNVINHSTVSYDSNFVVTGGANYPIDDSFDVRVEVSDRFNTAAAQTVVATAAVFQHWAKTGVGVGKYHERGAIDAAGDVYANGKLLLPAAAQSDVDAGVSSVGAVTPQTLREREHAPWAQACGEVTAGANTSGAVVVNFPAGRFTRPPNVQVTLRGFVANAGVLVSAVSATQATVGTFNTASGTNISAVPFQWAATQMAATSASG